MCGIFGMVKVSGDSIRESEINLARLAADMMQRRGPDDEGYWHNDSVLFSFRRLAILDLSPAGHQPMQSACSQYTIVFNGELYNYESLKNELQAKGHTFRSRSDTEVVLASLIEWDTDAFSRFNGMFALAFWNNRDQTLLIACDHVGMKPLYFTRQASSFVFASQLDQVLLCCDKNSLHLDHTGLALFLSLGYYPGHRTVFNEIRQLESGQWMKVRPDGTMQTGEHFNLQVAYLQSQERIATVEELEDAVKTAVKRHLMSDVPIGTFLSGGLDSGIITGMVHKLIGSSFSAYTLSNRGTVYDETDRAARVADFLNIPHKIVYPGNILETVKSFHDAYQEPFGDYSGIPSMMVTAEARRHVKVMLSGDGSDEFFFGYNRMLSMLQSAEFYNYPFLVRRLIKKIKPSIPALTFKDFPAMVLRRQSFVSEEILSSLSVREEDLAHEFIGPYKNGHELPRDIVIKLNTIQRYFRLQLLKLDRASMFNSIEARVPFADKELMKLTIAYKAKDVTSNHYRSRKVPLQKMYNKLYPHMEFESGLKKGFTIDMGSMLNGDLKEFFTTALEEDTFFSGYIDFKKERQKFLTGNNCSPFFYWSLLSLQMWAKKYLPS